MKHFFQGLEGNWFLHAEASTLYSSEKPVDRERTHSLSKKKKKIKGKHVIDCTAPAIEEGCHGVNEDSVAATSRERFGFIRPNYKVENREKCNSSTETFSESSSEVISVTGIINRYFPNFEELRPSGSPVNSEITSIVIQNKIGDLKAKKGDTRLQVEAMPELTPRTPQKMLTYRSVQNPTSTRSSDKHNGAAVWERLLMASNHLGIPGSKQRPVISVCRFIDGKLSGPHSSSPIRSSVFEISDSD